MPISEPRGRREPSSQAGCRGRDPGAFAADRALRALRGREEHGRRRTPQDFSPDLDFRVGHHPAAASRGSGRAPIPLCRRRRVRPAGRRRGAAGVGAVRRPSVRHAARAARREARGGRGLPAGDRRGRRAAGQAGRARGPAGVPGPAVLGRAGPQAHRPRHRAARGPRPAGSRRPRRSSRRPRSSTSRWSTHRSRTYAAS